MDFKLWLESKMLTVYRGTGALGLKELRPSEDGVYGPGIYFYDNLESAKAYAEPGGGVVVAQVDLDDPQIITKEKPVYVVGTQFLLRKERIVIVPDASKIRIIKTITTSGL
jgi:hypothetical protein